MRGLFKPPPLQPPDRTDAAAVRLDLLALFATCTRTPVPASLLDDGGDVSLLELGADSLASVVFARRVSARYAPSTVRAVELLDPLMRLSTLVDRIASGGGDDGGGDDGGGGGGGPAALPDGFLVAEVDRLVEAMTEAADSPHRSSSPETVFPTRVLVTGATGFLGSAVVAAAFDAWPSSAVVCLVRDPTSDRAVALRGLGAGVQVIAGDLADESADVLDGGVGDVDLVIHTAANTNTLLAYDDLKRYFRKPGAIWR